MEIQEKMEKLIEELNYYTKLYDEGHPAITDIQWDRLYYELQDAERIAGYALPNSPTQSISYEVVNKLEKVEHNHPMLSLPKTKSEEDIMKFIDGHAAVAMCKMDGLTCSLHYKDGKLISAETRGDGIIGENVYHNAIHVNSVPKIIDYLDELIVDGEMICTYENFKPFEDDYKNPRNFASGSIRLFDSREAEQRNLDFVAWEVISGFREIDSLAVKLNKLGKLGFKVVPYIQLYPKKDIQSIKASISACQDLASEYAYPIDGIVFKFDSYKYSDTLGRVNHHFNNAIAFKFYDEEYETNLINIEWTMGRTGVLTPVAIFEPVDTGDSIVEKSSLHNFSVMLDTLGHPYKDEPIKIAKMNMIIPQVVWADYVKVNEDTIKNHEFISYPEVCPICGGSINREISESGTENLVCGNADCSGKLINRINHFCGKSGLDIKGLSEATLEKLIDWGWVSGIKDIFNLNQYRVKWSLKPGFGAKSVENILKAIEASKTCELDKFICAIGIPLIGTVASKELAKHFNTWENFINAVDNEFKFWTLPDFGPEAHSAIHNFCFADADELASFLKINPYVKSENDLLRGKVFVITGSVKQFKNRDELKEKIESYGGKVSSSVSKNTSYLINNDTESSSSKNSTAKKLNVPIISEEEFIKLFIKNT